MDTKLTKFKYSITAKILCVTLSAIMFFSFVYSAVIIFAQMNLYGAEDFLSSKKPSYYETYAFSQIVTSDANLIYQISKNNSDDIQTTTDSVKTAIIDEAANMYLDEKSKIIKNELLYAVENYDSSYFAYEHVADLIDLPEDSSKEHSETTTVVNQENTTVPSTAEMPKNIETAMKILKTCEGHDFLNYDILVRSSAFTESLFVYNSDIPYTAEDSIYFDFSSDYTLSEKEIRNELTTQYNSVIKSTICELNEYTSYAMNDLLKHKTLKYYCTDNNGNIKSNINNITTEQFINNASKNTFFVFIEDNNCTFSGCTEELKDYINNIISENISGCKIYFYIDDSEIKSGEDIYSNLYFIHERINHLNSYGVIICAIVFLTISLLSLSLNLKICGFKRGFDGCIITKKDKIPGDLHFLLAIGSVTVIIVTTLFTIFEIANLSTRNNHLILYSPVIISVIMTAAYLIITGWITSIARIRKSGDKIRNNLLIRRIASIISKKLKSLINKLIAVFGYKPKQIERTTVVAVVGYVSGNFIILVFSIFASLLMYSLLCAVLGFIAAVIYNTICVYFALKYIKNLDRIIDASCRHESIDFGNEKPAESLRLLSANLTNTNEALAQAVAKAIKDEQMKTELITNVSHDLKTPLTSLISYSDLLEKCNITDEDAIKYIEVIHTQSIKLKRLIDDLIEASKVSTGNVTLNMTKLNLSELAVQVIAEFSPEMERNGNEIRFSQPETAPTIYADGSKTYRILSNLLSNAKKYSAPDTRIYISVYTDNISSYFEIKNISKDPLNIMPDELTERFVRGDKSRSKEGNGLGLSIAKDLCNLQNGYLHISIDGDLFKAVVKLPSSDNIIS